MDKAVYQDIILGHFRDASHRSSIDPETKGVCTIRNPNCGDLIPMKVDIQPDQTVVFSHNAQGCAASVASTSILCDTLNGMSVRDAQTVIGSFLAQFQSDRQQTDLNLMDGLQQNVEIEALLFFRDIPSRALCVSLAWQCAEKALAEQITKT